MSSVFGSASAICADYFGDEYGVPLLSSTIKKKGVGEFRKDRSPCKQEQEWWQQAINDAMG